MTMKDTMLPELMKKDGIDGLAHPIDDLAMLGEGSAFATIGGETGGSMLTGDGIDNMAGSDMMTDTGTECATEVERSHDGVESDSMPEMAMAGVGGEGIVPDGQEI